MDGLLAARIVSMICLGLVTWIIGIAILAFAYNPGLSTTLVDKVSNIKNTQNCFYDYISMY